MLLLDIIVRNAIVRYLQLVAWKAKIQLLSTNLDGNVTLVSRCWRVIVNFGKEIGSISSAFHEKYKHFVYIVLILPTALI